MNKCRFCSPDYQKERNIIENKHFFANFDNNPVTKGHMKIIPKRHVDSFFDLTDEEITAAYDLLKKAKTMLDKKYKPDAYNTGINDGKAAGQTVFHLHIHLIPRYFGDTEDPIGGVRNVIPEKGNYLKK
jgi:diadenosine tetraphosphate (Ap4A) HIT family hydrolase